MAPLRFLSIMSGSDCVESGSPELAEIHRAQIGSWKRLARLDSDQREKSLGQIDMCNPIHSTLLFDQGIALTVTRYTFVYYLLSLYYT